MAKIKTPLPPIKSRDIPRQQAPDPLLRFSFQYLDTRSNDKFAIRRCGAGYLERFLERLRDVSTLSVRQFRTNASKSLRAHTHDWQRTTEKNGFTCLNENLRDEEAWQFEISSNEHGRVHGFLIADIFFVVWIDPDHLLYS